MPLPPGYPPGSTLEVVSQLEGMGFTRELTEQAVASTKAGTEGGPSLQAALDWLCQTPRQGRSQGSPVGEATLRGAMRSVSISEAPSSAPAESHMTSGVG